MPETHGPSKRSTNERKIMKTLRTISLLTGAILLAGSAPAVLAGTDSGESYADALARAKSSEKPLVLDFFTEW